MSDADEIDTGNDCLVGMLGDRVTVMMRPQQFTPEQAVRHAAWLVAIAEILDPSVDFDAVRAAVNKT